MLANLFQKKLLLVTGKGGVGKSVVSAALALEATRIGKRVCLVECTAEDQLGPLLGVGKVGHELKAVSEHLKVINLDPELNFRDFIVLHLGFQSLFDKVFSQGIIRSFIRMIPGISEMTLLGRLYYFSELDLEDQFDLVIFDGFASGHFLSLLATPAAILNAGFVGPIIKETERVRAFLNDKDRCGVVLVNTPEDLVMNESLDFLERLKNQNPPEIAGIIINRLLRDTPLTNSENPDIKTFFSQLRVKEGVIQKVASEFAKSLDKRFRDLAIPVIALPEFFIHEEPFDLAAATRWLNMVSPCPM